MGICSGPQNEAHLCLKADSHILMENDKTKTDKTSKTQPAADPKLLSQKLHELEIQKEKLEETIKAREEQLLNLFSYIEATAK